jgi:hypothetical protein
MFLFSSFLVTALDSSASASAFFFSFFARARFRARRAFFSFFLSFSASSSQNVLALKHSSSSVLKGCDPQMSFIYITYISTKDLLTCEDLYVSRRLTCSKEVLLRLRSDAHLSILLEVRRIQALSCAILLNDAEKGVFIKFSQRCHRTL